MNGHERTLKGSQKGHTCCFQITEQSPKKGGRRLTSLGRAPLTGRRHRPSPARAVGGACDERRLFNHGLRVVAHGVKNGGGELPE